MPQTGMIVLGHGSRRGEVGASFKAMVERIAKRLGAGPVLPAFFSLSKPTLSEQITFLIKQGCTRIVVMQFFLCNGVHIEKDIPEEIQAWQQRYPHVDFILLPTLEGDPALEQLVAKRLQNA